MPKLDGTQIADRLRGRLEDLQKGKEVAAKDIRVLLSDEQEAAMDAAWIEQQALRKIKRARTKDEEVALGWKSKREIQIEAYEKAIAEADDGMLETLDEMQRKAEVRQARIYMQSYSKAIEEGKTGEVAKNVANNNLTRAGLKRVDGQVVGHLNARDKEIWEMERQIQQRAEHEMDDYEREQIELLKAHAKAVVENRKKQGG